MKHFQKILCVLMALALISIIPAAAFAVNPNTQTKYSSGSSGDMSIVYSVSFTISNPTDSASVGMRAIQKNLTPTFECSKMVVSPKSGASHTYPNVLSSTGKNTASRTISIGYYNTTASVTAYMSASASGLGSSSIVLTAS